MKGFTGFENVGIHLTLGLAGARRNLGDLANYKRKVLPGYVHFEPQACPTTLRTACRERDAA